jgi:hypothetical protein
MSTIGSCKSRLWHESRYDYHRRRNDSILLLSMMMSSYAWNEQASYRPLRGMVVVDLSTKA